MSDLEYPIADLGRIEERLGIVQTYRKRLFTKDMFAWPTTRLLRSRDEFYSAYKLELHRNCRTTLHEMNKPSPQ